MEGVEDASKVQDVARMHGIGGFTSVERHNPVVTRAQHQIMPYFWTNAPKVDDRPIEMPLEVAQCEHAKKHEHQTDYNLRIRGADHLH